MSVLYGHCSNRPRCASEPFPQKSTPRFAGFSSSWSLVLSLTTWSSSSPSSPGYYRRLIFHKGMRYKFITRELFFAPLYTTLPFNYLWWFLVCQHVVDDYGTQSSEMVAVAELHSTHTHTGWPLYYSSGGRPTLFGKHIRNAASSLGGCMECARICLGHAI